MVQLPRPERGREERERDGERRESEKKEREEERESREKEGTDGGPNLSVIGINVRASKRERERKNHGGQAREGAEPEEA